MEADLQRYYQIRLTDLFAGRLTWRRLRVLVAGLPAEATTVRRVEPDTAWSVGDHLLATLVDTERLALWQRGGGKGRRPRPIPRPGAAGPERSTQRLGGTTRPAAQVRAYLDQFRPQPVELN